MSARIICCISALYGERARGGAERIAQDEASGLSATGHSVSVITASPDVSRTYVHDGITVREVHPPNLCFFNELQGKSWFYRLVWHVLDVGNVVAARRVRAVLAEVMPDVVHTHNLMGLGFMIPRMLRRMGIPHVHTVHDVQLLHPSGLLSSSFERPRALHVRLYIAIMRMVMGSPDVVVFPSRRLRELHEMNGFFPRSFRKVVRNPAPPALHGDRVLPSSSRFAFIGQLEPHKGIMTLLDAWEAEPRLAGVQLLIAGSGSLTATVVARVERMQDVAFLGHIDRKRVLEVLSDVSHVILPSEVIENAPTVLLEAMACGTPAVAADVGGVSELVHDGETGFLFPSGDITELRTTLVRASALEQWEAMSAASKARAATMSRTAHIDSLEEIYHDIA